MQTPTTVEPAPAPPAPPGTPGAPIVVRIPGVNIPTSRQEIAAIRARRRELSNQLTSAAERRESLAEELVTADPSARAGLEQRIAVLDERIVRLEQDIAETGRQLTGAPTELLVTSTSTASGFPNLDPGQITGISIVFILFFLFPLALSLSRLMWKRATAPARAAIPRETSAQLQRLEQAVDTVALEMERVSEAQRFMTKLLTEPNALSALGNGQLREPVPTRKGEA